MCIYIYIYIRIYESYICIRNIYVYKYQSRGYLPALKAPERMQGVAYKQITYLYILNIYIYIYMYTYMHIV